METRCLRADPDGLGMMRRALTGVGLPLLAAVCLLLVACQRQPGKARPFIQFTTVPRAGEGNPYKLVTIEGRVLGARPGQQVVVYAYSRVWWVQPLADHPYTSIQPDSTWKCSTHPGMAYAALVVDPGYRPPASAIVLPKVGDGIAGVASVDGEPMFWQTWWFRTIVGLMLVALAFAAYRWRLGNIEERELHFRKLAENSPDIVMRFDSELRCCYVNPIIEEYTGLPPRDLLGRTIGEIGAFKKNDRYWEASLRQVFETGKRSTQEFTFDTPKGERHFESRLVPEGGSDGVTRSVLVVTRDVTGARRAEEELQAAMSERARLAAVRAEIGMALARKDSLKGVLDLCAKALVQHLDATFARIWTLNREGRELELQASAGIYTRLDGEFGRIPFGKFKIGSIAQAAKPHVTNDVQNDSLVDDHEWAKAEKITSFAGYPLVVEDRVVGVMGMFSREALTPGTVDTLSFIADGIAQSIERKHAEDALRSSEQTFRLIVESIPGLVSTTNADGEIEIANRQLLQYVGKTVEELKDWHMLVHPDDVASTAVLWNCSIETGDPYDDEYRLRRADGVYRWFRVRGLPVRNQGGQIVRWYVLLTDVDERKRAVERVQRSESYLAEGQRLAHTGSWAWNTRTRDAFWSEEMFRILGYDPEKTTPTLSHFMERVHPEDRPRIGRKAQMESAGVNEDAEADFRIVLTDGTIKQLHSVARLVCDEMGEVIEVVGTTMDVTDRKRAESLLAGEKRILELVAKGESLAEILDSLCRIVEEQASGVLASILLLDGDRLRHGGAPSLPKAYTDAIDGAAIGPSRGSCGTAAYHGKQVIVEDIATDPLWANYLDLALPFSLRACWSTPIFSSKGKVIATFAMYYREPRRPSPRDQETIERITHLAGIAIERKLAEDALRRSEAYLAESQRLSRTGSWALNPATGETIYCSPEMFRIFGFDPQEGLPGLDRFRERVHPEDRPRVIGSFDKAAREKADFVEDQRIVLPDGQVKQIHITGHPVLAKTGELVEYVGTAIDVTDRKAAEEGLRAAETRFRTFVDHATDALFVDDEQGRIIDVNRRACESLGYTREELIGMAPRNFDSALDEAFRQSVNQRLAGGETIAFETSYRRKDGTEFPVELRARPFWHGGHRFALALARDITERKRAEEERERLRQAQAALERVTRVTSMGELTASLAHEINQPIAAAITDSNTCLRWLTREPPDVEEARLAASRIVKAASRAADIVKRVRAMFKKGTPQREAVDVNEVIREMIALLRNEATRHLVLVRTQLGADLPRVMADRVQLQQVLTNLMLNAIEAMTDMNAAGELTIQSQRGDNGDLLVSISDTGVGLAPEQADQLFQAFFTTKPDGTGMGLPISRSIIESHGGRLWASANSGRGATFHFTLPGEAGGLE